MIFLTVGTRFPFDRLIKAVDDAVGARLIEDEVFAQVGEGGYRPRNMKWAETLDRATFARYVAESQGLIGHAGMGTIDTAMDCDKPLLVMPRLRRYREHVNDHQVATARKFEALGHVIAAYDAGEVAAKVAELKTFKPRRRHARPEAVIARVADFLAAEAAKLR